MRAWAEMFDAFLAGVGRPRRGHLAVHRRRLLRPRRRQAPLRRRPRLPHVAAASSCPRATRRDPPDADHGVRAGQPQERRLQRRPRPRRRRRPYPGSVALLDRAARRCGCRSRSSRRRPTPPRCSRRPGWPTASSPSSTAGSPPRSGSPASRPPTPSSTPPRSAAPRPARVGRRRGRRLGRAGGRRRWLRPRHRRRPRGGRRRPHRGRGRPRRRRPRGARVKPGARSRPTRSTAAASPSTRGASSSATPTARDLGVTETLFTRRQRLHRHARQPRGGPRRLRARHLRQRLPRDLADPARRGGLRLRRAPARPSSTCPTPS